MNVVDEIFGTDNQSSSYNNRQNSYLNNRNYNNGYNNYPNNRNYNNRYNDYSNNRNYNNRYNNYSDNRNYNNNQNKWKQKLNQDKEKIYATMDAMSYIISRDSEKFEEYLDIQSRFEKYSVGNCLVILKEAPNSIQFKDKKSWQEKGIELIKNAKSFQILEPNVSNNGITYWNPKEVFDISQTTATRISDIEYDTRKLLEAIVKTCPVKRKQMDKLPDGRLGAVYNKSKDILYVCEGMERDLLFQTLFQEIANIEMRNDKESNIKNFRSYCIAYMLCRKYGIDVPNYNFSNLTNEIANSKETKDIRRELEIIRSNFGKVNERIVNYLEQDNQERNKKVTER